MTSKILYWSTSVFAGLALFLFVVDASLINANQRLQGEINTRQNVINTALNVTPINQQLSQALYDASLKKNDKQIQELLVQQGYKLPEQQPAQAAKPTPAKQPVAKSAPKKEEE